MGDIANVGGCFLTRLPLDRDPHGVADKRPFGGGLECLTDRSLEQAVRGLKRDIVDVTCTSRCTVRTHRSAKNHRVEETDRVVALRNPKTRRSTLIVTDVSEDRLPAELVGASPRACRAACGSFAGPTIPGHQTSGRDGGSTGGASTSLRS